MRLYRILIYTAVFVVVSFSVVFSYIFADFPNGNQDAFIKKRILLIADVYQNQYWLRVREGAEDAAYNRDCIIEYNGPQTFNMDESLRIFDMGIATSVDGIITSVQEEKHYISIIKKAIDIGIPVITIDTDAKKSKRIAYVGTNNMEAGSYAGQKLAEISMEKATIGIIMAGKTVTSQVERVDGFKQYISGHDYMKIVAVESSNSDIIEAELVAKKMISEHPEIDAIYCTSSVDGIGAARAVVDDKKIGKMKIVCFDDLPETLDYIKQNIIQASIVQKPYQMGYDSVNLMMDKLEGKDVEGESLIEPTVVTRDNVNNYNSEKGEMN